MSPKRKSQFIEYIKKKKELGLNISSKEETLYDKIVTGEDSLV